MKSGKLGILDYETNYAANLMDYLNRREDFGFEVCMFTGMESLEEFIIEERLEILLIGERFPVENLEGRNIQNIFVLSEGNCVKEETTYQPIYKFQSMDTMVKDIMVNFAGKGGGLRQEPVIINPGQVEFISVVSPKGGSGKTTFSIALGQACGKSERVLYLNFEPIGSSIGLKEDKSSMSDLIYFMKQKKRGIILAIQSMGEKIGGVDCITSVTHFDDLFAIEKEDIDYLMEELIKSQIYRKVIFDIGYLDEITLSILERCNAVYVTHLQKDCYMDKSRAFERIFKYEEKESLHRRMKEVNLPKDHLISSGDYTLGSLLEGELGKFIWGLLSSNGR